MTWLAAFLAALPYADRWMSLIAADRAAGRKHARDTQAKGGAGT